MAFVIWLALGVGGRALRTRATLKLRRATFIIVVFLFFQIARVLIDPAIPDVYLLAATRFIYIAALCWCVSKFGQSGRKTIVNILSFLLVPMILFELLVAFIQTQGAPAYFGASFIGPRPWGTYSSPNNLGLAALSMAILFAVSDLRSRGLWFAFAGAVCLATGSRTAVLGVLFVLVGVLLARFRSRWILVPYGIPAFFLLYKAASSSAISGRTIVAEGRFAVWSDVLNGLSTPFLLLVGNGLGSGTNAVASLDKSVQQSARSGISDSTFVTALASLGMIGLATFIFLGAVVAFYVTSDRRLTVLPALLLAALVFDVPEISPINVLGAVAIGAAWKMRPEAPGGVALK